MRRQGMSQNKLAPRLGVTQSQVSKLLRGEVQMTLTAVDSFAEALEVPVDELLQDEGVSGD